MNARWTPFYLAIAALAASGMAWADVAPEPLTTGGTNLSPKPANGAPITVEMVAEEVDLYPSAKLNRVTARFVLKNTGEADAEFEVGFPSYYKMPLQDFEVTVDGKPQAAEVKQTGGGGRKQIFTYWMCWPMTFPRGVEREVVVKYAVETERVFPKLHIDKLPPDLKDQIWQRSSGYVLRTGAAWAGKIGRAVIRLHYGDDFRKELVTALLPKRGWKYDAASNTDTLTLTDFEPTDGLDNEGRPAADIRYEWRALTPAQEFDALYTALEQKRIDPWAMEYLLDLAEKQNARKLGDAEKAALARDILERMLPPRGPEAYAHEISPGAENVLVKAHRRLSKIYADAGEADKAAALDTGFRALADWIKADRARRRAEAAEKRANPPPPSP
mgnify:CR=1 FL=1